MLPNAPSDLPWRVLGTAKRVRVWNLHMLPNHGINGDGNNQSWLLTDLAELAAHFQLKRLAA